MKAPPLTIDIVARKSYKLLEPVRVRMVMTNRTGLSLEYELDHEKYKTFEIAATRAGKKAKSTAYRDQMDEDGAVMSKTMGLHEKTPTEYLLDANLVNDMTIPGKYNLQVTYKHFDQESRKLTKIVSNVVPVEIVRD